MLRIVQSCGIALALLLPVQVQATHGVHNGLPEIAAAELPVEAHNVLSAAK